MSLTRQTATDFRVEPDTFRKLAALSDIHLDDLRDLGTLPHNDMAVGRKRALIDTHTDPARCFILTSGWAYSFSMLPNGRRQVFHIYQDGDLIGFDDLMFTRNALSVNAVTNCRLADIRGDHMRASLAKNPRLSFYLHAMSSMNQIVIMDRMQAIARLEPKARMAHFLLEVMSRTRVTSDFHNGRKGRSSVFNMPMRQGLIADCIGMSAVHVSRTLTWFVDESIITRPARHIFDVLDEDRMIEMCGFKNRYTTVSRIIPA